MPPPPNNIPAARAASPSASVGSAVALSRNFLRTQYWIWPLVAAVILIFVGVFVRRQMEGAMKAQIAGNLTTILRANTEALRAWAATVKSQAEAVADDARVSDLVAGLMQRAAQQGTSQAALLATPQLAPLRKLLQPELEPHGFNGYVVITPDLVIAAAGREQLIGIQSPPGYKEHLRG